MYTKACIPESIRAECAFSLAPVFPLCCLAYYYYFRMPVF